jgi:transposase-like protein
MARKGPRGSGRRTRRPFSDEFIAGAVRLVLDQGKTVGAVARELALTPSAPDETDGTQTETRLTVR